MELWAKAGRYSIVLYSMNFIVTACMLPLHDQTVELKLNFFLYRDRLDLGDGKAIFYWGNRHINGQNVKNHLLFTKMVLY